MTKPISPADVALRKSTTIPAVVIEAVNELIVEKWRGNGAVILQRDIVALVQKRDPTIAAQMFERGWMDFEDAYRQEGWTVSHDKPGYNETYEASFSFAKKRTP